MPNDNEPQKTLWMLVCDIGFERHLKAFYAISEKDAQSQAQQWLEKLPGIGIPISLRAYPRGFTIAYVELPGKV